jgi:hypothetical protein
MAVPSAETMAVVRAVTRAVVRAVLSVFSSDVRWAVRKVA